MARPNITGIKCKDPKEYGRRYRKINCKKISVKCRKHYIKNRSAKLLYEYERRHGRRPDILTTKCSMCGKEIMPSTKPDKRCKPCQKEHSKEYQKQYNKVYQKELYSFS